MESLRNFDSAETVSKKKNRGKKIITSLEEVAFHTPNPFLDKRKAASHRFKLQDKFFFVVTAGCSSLLVIIFFSLFAALVISSWPVFEKLGISFFIGTEWEPHKNIYGSLVALYGTVATSFIALFFAVPISFGIAVFLTEICPTCLRSPLGIAIELLAAVPSIIYGFWGLFVLAPVMQSYVQPLLQQINIPIFEGPPLGVGILTAGVVLALMVIPFIAAVMRDMFESVPSMLRESAYGLGCTTWEVLYRIVVPYCREGVLGGIMLGFGRALGETMAVTFVIGNTNLMHFSLLSPGCSISSTLANEFSEADGVLHVPALFALGLMLFFITFFVLGLSRFLVKKKNYLSKG